MVTAVGIPKTKVHESYSRSNSGTRLNSDNTDVSNRVLGGYLAKKPYTLSELKKLLIDYNINLSSNKPKSPQDIFNILSELSTSFQNLTKDQKSTLRSKLVPSFVSLLTENLNFPSYIAKKEVNRVLNKIFKGPKAVSSFKDVIMKFEGAPEQLMNTFNEVSNKLADLPKVILAKEQPSSEESSYNNSLAA
jgi:hypothetical protein